MGIYDPSILPFYSLPYIAATYSTPSFGQHYKQYRDRAIKEFSTREKKLNDDNIFIYAIASEDEAIKNIIFKNKNKLFSPIDYSYYAIELDMKITETTPRLTLYINRETLSKKIKDEFDSAFADKFIDKNYLFINSVEFSTCDDTKSYLNPLFSEVLKFFLARSEFIPVKWTDNDNDLIYRFIYKKEPEISLKWKTIKEITDFLIKNKESYLLGSSKRYAMVDLVDGGESSQYKPSDEVYYFCKFNYNKVRYYLKRDLEKSPKPQKKPASN